MRDRVKNKILKYFYASFAWDGGQRRQWPTMNSAISCWRYRHAARHHDCTVVSSDFSTRLFRLAWHDLPAYFGVGAIYAASAC